MMKRRIAVTVIFVVLVGFSDQAYGAARIGSSCSKVSSFQQSGKTLLVCDLIKKKKVWRKTTAIESKLYKNEQLRIERETKQKILDAAKAESDRLALEAKVKAEAEAAQAAAEKAAAEKAAAEKAAAEKAAAEKAAADAAAKAAADAAAKAAADAVAKAAADAAAKAAADAVAKAAADAAAKVAADAAAKVAADAAAKAAAERAAPTPTPTPTLAAPVSGTVQVANFQCFNGWSGGNGSACDKAFSAGQKFSFTSYGEAKQTLRGGTLDVYAGGCVDFSTPISRYTLIIGLPSFVAYQGAADYCVRFTGGTSAGAWMTYSVG